jgi:hypothetical protein
MHSFTAQSPVIHKFFLPGRKVETDQLRGVELADGEHLESAPFQGYKTSIEDP